MVISGNGENVIQALKERNLYDVADLHFNVPHKEVNRWVGQSDVLVIPRPRLKMIEYAYPSKLPEFLATGVPVVVTDVGPVKELFGGQRFCIIIDTEDISKNIKESLINIQKMNKEERAKLGEEAINFVRENLTWDILGQQINQALLKI